MKIEQSETGKYQRPKSMAQRIREMAKSGQKTGSSSAAKISRNPKTEPDERYKWIAQAAYFRAEKRGFTPGGEMEDWLEAEAEIEQLFGK